MMKMKQLVGKRMMSCCMICLVLIGFPNCHKKSSDTNTGGTTPVTPPATHSDVDFYLTTGNQASLLQKQNTILHFSAASNGYPDIIVDSSQSYQSVDGFGYALTDASAYLITTLPSSMQNDLLKELFGNDSNSISVSYLRVSIGASDLSAAVYT